MKLTAFASVALLASGASTAGTHAVNKRSVEGVHLANCNRYSFAGPVEFSQIIYYADDTPAGKSAVPSTSNQCRVTKEGQGFKTWEGSSVTCIFPSNTYFTANIQSGAAGYNFGKYAGSGKNNYRNFNCYRDNNLMLFDDGDYYCKSIYYCRDA
ncbi:hypothetical protein C8A01DRAFT_39069 [Parachaetomium inaequale]|uniref:Uncharacterized protein n=1 Tax=Parachaetomium inaequale TaxID=2588326 RepID=A0AAN6SP65_9PEZI|nr:hypothetical protein C8A01DRAFT_39069 [Parachaetomium inaequale]